MLLMVFQEGLDRHGKELTTRKTELPCHPVRLLEESVGNRDRGLHEASITLVILLRPAGRELGLGHGPPWTQALAGACRFALPLDKQVRHLSKGNVAKLALVAALGHAPRLLLLDEPTAGLDPVVRSEVLDVLWEVLEDGEHAMFYSTHVLSDISRLADELVFLRDGRILLRSSKDALTDGWRRISFRLGERDVAVAAAVEYRRVRAEHQVVSDNGEATLAQLRELGAEAVEQSRMTIDEIAVTILKGGSHVAVG
jgi:energy-coupling factor transporter ATP-binding protein EcfA2